MKKHSLLILMSLILTSCFTAKDAEEAATGTTASINPNLMSGVAATGAPISKGKVKVKGKSGNTVETTTSSNGSYSINIGLLESPYLVKVLAPSGEQYISVSSKSALVAGKKVNITPLTHAIVSNVFSEADPDTLFADFQAQAVEFSEAKLETEKGELLQKLIDANLIGAGSIAGASIDLLGGAIEAGTSNGIDGLLDVLDFKSAGGSIEITFKGSESVIISDNVADGAADTVNMADSTALDDAKTQLTMIDHIRNSLNSLATVYSSYSACGDVPIAIGGNCDIATIYNSFFPFFHNDFQEDGIVDTQILATYAWICGDESGASSDSLCVATGNTYEFANVTLTDVSLISFVGGIAHVSFNLYENGIMRGVDDMRLKQNASDATLFQLVGNEKTFRYWIDTESVHGSSFNMTTGSQAPDTYDVGLSFYFDSGKTFAVDDQLLLSALSNNLIFSSDSSQMIIYVVKSPKYDSNNVCTEETVFSTSQTPYMAWDNNTGNEIRKSFAQACTNGSACNCSDGTNSYYFDWSTNKVNLTPTQISQMNKVEKIKMTGPGVAGDFFYIKKPIVINEFNASALAPQIGMSVPDFCGITVSNYQTPFNLSSPSGKITYASLWYSYDDGSLWGNMEAQGDFWNDDSATASFNPMSTNTSQQFSTLAGSETLKDKNFYLASRDEFDRELVRRVNCHQ